MNFVRNHYGKILSFIFFLSYLILLPAGLKIIWPILMNLPGAEHQLIFYLIVALGSNSITFWTYNLVMWYIYLAKIPFFQQFRDDDRPWPWQIDNQKWKLALKNTLINVFINMYLVASLFPIIEYYIAKSSYQRDLEKWPSTLTIFLQFSFCLLMEDLTFYWSHTLFHHPKLYFLHKRHHQYAPTVSIAAVYAHPLEFILGNVLPTGIGYHILGKFMRVHFVTIIVWLAFRLNEGIQVHSGYNWSWRQLSFFPFKAGPQHHSFHHTFNSGNFSSMFQFWDIMMKTDRQYLSLKSKSMAHKK